MAAEQFKGKRVPWSHLEDYLSVHQGTITAYLDLLRHQAMDKPTIETLLPNSFWIIHQTVSKILKENDIMPQEEESKVDQL